jgi:acyl-CoA thioesterase-1
LIITFAVIATFLILLVFILMVLSPLRERLPNASAPASGLVKFLVQLCLLLSSSYAYTSERTLLVYGDSISAAYGMEQSQGWVHLLGERLDTTMLGNMSGNMPGYKVVNASVSGETTDGGVVRLPKTLAVHQPDIVIIELGGNDGLRGYPIDKISANINQMIRLSQASGARVLLVGMVLPPNYGQRYTTAFADVFQQAAESYAIPLVPFLLDGVATAESLMQRDGIHPRAEAQPLLLDNIWPYLQPLLAARPALDISLLDAR